ncbi:C2H2 type master regulator of conidiophore development brlA [Fusarium oxysporum f. sp. albedinis]|nr:C2H2 type master regulator of conidiophore development brlA [Fusarium oxysporum f. sp. albedinis]
MDLERKRFHIGGEGCFTEETLGFLVLDTPLLSLMTQLVSFVLGLVVMLTTHLLKDLLQASQLSDIDRHLEVAAEVCLSWTSSRQIRAPKIYCVMVARWVGTQVIIHALIHWELQTILGRYRIKVAFSHVIRTGSGMSPHTVGCNKFEYRACIFFRR